MTLDEMAHPRKTNCGEKQLSGTTSDGMITRVGGVLLYSEQHEYTTQGNLGVRMLIFGATLDKWTYPLYSVRRQPQDKFRTRRLQVETKRPERNKQT